MLQNLQRWHWVVIGIVVGIVIGTIKGNLDNVDLADVSGGMGQQDVFEKSILQPIVYDGVPYPQWQNVYVVRVDDPHRASGAAYTVLGKYHESGKYRIIERSSDGKPVVRWTERFYKAPSPYVPRSPIVGAMAQPALKLELDGLRRLAEALHLKESEEPDSVISFLAKVQASQPGFSFQYKWWRRPRINFSVAILISVTAIGGVWPFVVNLLTYGKLFAPPREKPVKPSKPSVATKPSTPAKPAVTQADLTHLRQLEAEIEAKLAHHAGSAEGSIESVLQETTTARSVVTAAPKVLSGERLEALPDEAKEAAEFKARKDDFYPTHRQHRRE